MPTQRNNAGARLRGALVFAAKVENPQCKEIESPKGFPRHVQRSGGSRHYFCTGSYAKGYSLWIEAELEIGEMRF